MAESDTEDADITDVLLQYSDDESDSFTSEHVISAKRRKPFIPGPPENTDIDILPTEVPTKSKLTGSSFKNMGFGMTLLKAIARKGYKNPTPIQRKTIPPIMEGRDVVGMARTGSGKTASFVLPIIENLKIHSAKVGARTIVLSPSRELALQTLKVFKEMSRGTDLRTVLLVGGDSLEDQFGSIMQNPDIIVATPGRFLHLLVEMDLDLRSVQYVVFDEADRQDHLSLFEMGFETQLTEVLHRLPQTRQTLLFSATLPKSLVDFAKAGLQDPLLIRLDVEQKISEDLETAFFTIKPVEKQAGLLYVIQELIKVPTGNTSSVSPETRKRKRSNQSANGIVPQSTLIFVSTKHQAEFITALLRKANYPVSCVYGTLDQVARRENVESFRSGESSILVVTDVAARGIDIPILSNVINYDFPSEPKIFVHRVGRTARAGQHGWAYSLVTNDDASHFCELAAFLGRRIVMNGAADVNYANDLALGAIPRGDLERIAEWVAKVIGESNELSVLRSVAAKGDKLYQKTKGVRGTDMIKKAKALVQEEGWALVNPLLGNSCLECSNVVGEKQTYEDARVKLLNSVSTFRPRETIFEIGHKGLKGRTLAAEIMRARRSKITIKPAECTVKRDEDNDEDHQHATMMSKGSFQDSEHYIAHFEPSAGAGERGYDVNRSSHSFAEDSRAAVMNLQDDDGKSFAPSRLKQQWDAKKKKFVSRAIGDDGSGKKAVKLIKGESGVKIPASMKSGRFELWQKSHKTRLPQAGTSEAPNASWLSPSRFKHTKNKAPKPPDRHRDDYEKQKKKAVQASERRNEGGQLRTLDQVRKLRVQKERRKKKNARPSHKNK